MRLLTYAELLAEAPSVEFLIDGVLPRGAMAGIFARSGVGKSFVALSMLHHVARGIPFAGCRVMQGPGLYIVAEGFDGFGARARAWCVRREVDDPGPVRYLPEPVAFHDDGQIEALCAALVDEEFRPALIVIDTLAATSPSGFNENDTQHMTAFVNGIARLIKATGAAVLVIHHAGWGDDNRERGNSAFRGRVEVMLKLTKTGANSIELKVEKARDFPSGKTLPLALHAADGSLVAEEAPFLASGMLTAQEVMALRALLGVDEPLKATDWQVRSTLTPSSFYRTRADLAERGYIEQVQKRYTITEIGAEALASFDSHSQSTPKDSHGSGLASGGFTPSHSPSLRDGSGSGVNQTRVATMANGAHA